MALNYNLSHPQGLHLLAPPGQGEREGMSEGWYNLQNKRSPTPSAQLPAHVAHANSPSFSALRWYRVRNVGAGS